jgi:hypothetical protein
MILNMINMIEARGSGLFSGFLLPQLSGCGDTMDFIGSDLLLVQ